MATYSMQLREIIESVAGSERERMGMSNAEIIEQGRKKLFDFHYPIFDENYRKIFETHFIRTFYMREIGFETEGLFKFQLETWLNINMPYFNKLFQSENITYNPLSNTVTQTTRNTGKETEQTDKRESDSHSRTEGETDASSDTESTGTTKDDNFNRHITSNTPDGRLALTSTEGSGVIEYASSIEENMENNKQTTDTQSHTDTDESSDVKTTTDETQDYDSEINETTDYLEYQIGKVGEVSYPEMIMKHRQAFMRVENQIFDEMGQLFMLVY